MMSKSNATQIAEKLAAMYEEMNAITLKEIGWKEPARPKPKSMKELYGIKAEID